MKYEIYETRHKKEKWRNTYPTLFEHFLKIDSNYNKAKHIKELIKTRITDMEIWWKESGEDKSYSGNILNLKEIYDKVDLLQTMIAVGDKKCKESKK